MARSGTAVIAALAALGLAACSTTGGYEAPLVRSGVLTSEEAAEARTEASPAAVQPAAVSVNDDPFNTAGSDFVRYDSETYQLRDLDPGERPPLNSDEAGLWMQSDRFEARLRSSGNLIRDREINAYLQDITCKLADRYCGDIRVYLSQTPYFNALMTPNGTLNVWSGLLLRVDNEAQLAAVLAHEIGHYLRRHSVQLFRDARDKSNAAVFLSIGLGAFGPLAQLALLGAVFSYQRDMEREADGYSLLLLARAGYDPREASKIWHRILKEKEADPDADQAPAFYNSHPPSAERRDALVDLGELVFEKTAADAVGAERYQARIAPYRALLFNSEVDLRNFKRSQALFDMLLESDPNPAEVTFFKGELHRVRDDEGDAAAALALYKEAFTRGTPPPAIFRSQGLLMRRLGDLPAAAAAFRRYLQAAPESIERPFIESMIREMETS